MDIKRNIPYTGDYLRGICAELERIKIRESSKEFTEKDILKALKRNVSESPRVLSKKEIEIIANHEAAHAIIGMVEDTGNEVMKITVNTNSSEIGGYVFNREKTIAKTKNHFISQIRQGMAGYAIEMMVYGNPSVGSSSDIQNCSDLARSFIENFGFSNQLIAPRRNKEGQVIMSNTYLKKIDDEAEQILKDALEFDIMILKEFEEIHRYIVKELIEKKSIESEELVVIYQMIHEKVTSTPELLKKINYRPMI